ncbi:hypothetical protein Tco_0876336 [Tanacetum coccineum]|uniref:Integrase, catalytic region, zinc finger, CCHC-type, peptidase aspartic, catalytic n=1 Tax=Tanacetum coccineum TaxID=301880 RepID=A0ABQ5BS31_9ASTR
MMEGRLRWFGHVKRRRGRPILRWEDRLKNDMKELLFSKDMTSDRRVEDLVINGSRRRGRPKLRWEDRLKNDMKKLLFFKNMTSDRNDWRDGIKLGGYIRKDNGENIMKSINEGPFHMGTVSDVIARGTEGAVQQGPVHARVLNDLSAEEKERYKADIRATNILLQGIPKDIYSLINHYTDAKDIWENVKMILEGSELTKDDRESQLYDEFEHFCQNKGETIQGYYVRFTKLINDMRNIKMTMPRMQLNSKFVNNMLPEWSRFITKVKLNRGLKESNFDQLYAYLKQHEVHANENRTMMERFLQPTNDPLALVSNASVQHSSTENLIESLSNSLALLTQLYKSHLPQTNNQLRTSSNARNKATVQDGRVVVQDVRG